MNDQDTVTNEQTTRKNDINTFDQGSPNDDEDDEDDDSGDKESALGHSDDDEEEEESEWELESSDDDNNDDDNNEDDDDVDRENLQKRKSLFSLCIDSQLGAALKLFHRLQNTGQVAELKRQVFGGEDDRDGGRRQQTDYDYPIHEILMDHWDIKGNQLARKVLNFAMQYPNNYRRMLITPTKCNQRTALHWAVFRKAPIDIVKMLIVGNPNALYVEDMNGRTPADIYWRYFRSHGRDDDDDDDDEYVNLFQRTMITWRQYEIQKTIHLCAVRYFNKSVIEKSQRSHNGTSSGHLSSTMTPFCSRDRKETGIKPKNWFALSVLGVCLEREMKPLLFKILEYAGGNAPIDAKTKRIVGKSMKRKRLVASDLRVSRSVRRRRTQQS